MLSGYHPDSLRGFTFEEGYDLVIRTVYVKPKIVQELGGNYDFSKGEGWHCVIPRVYCTYQIVMSTCCFKKVTLSWAVSVGEGQAYVNETHGNGEGLNMLSSPYKPNFGKRRTAGFSSLIRRTFQQSEPWKGGFYRTFGKTMAEIDRYFYLGC